MEKNKMITLEQVKNHPDVMVYLKKANEFLGVIGYTNMGSGTRITWRKMRVKYSRRLDTTHTPVNWLLLPDTFTTSAT